MSITRVLGWVAIVLSALLLLADGAFRLADLTRDPPPTDLLDTRYVQHPWITFLHIVPGLLFLTLAPGGRAARSRASLCKREAPSL